MNIVAMSETFKEQRVIEPPEGIRAVAEGGGKWY